MNESRYMKRRILAYTVLTALLIVAVRHFELAMFAGQVPLKAAMLVVGAVFLGLGVYAGLRFRRRQSQPEIVVRTERVVEYVAQGSDAPLPDVGAGDPNTRPAVATELLSARELEVLREIANGLTNRQVGERLFVSENTIKTHLNSIYTKLGVNRRTQAIARARELRILA